MTSMSRYPPVFLVLFRTGVKKSASKTTNKPRRHSLNLNGIPMDLHFLRYSRKIMRNPKKKKSAASVLTSRSSPLPPPHGSQA